MLENFGVVATEWRGEELMVTYHDDLVHNDDATRFMRFMRFQLLLMLATEATGSKLVYSKRIVLTLPEFYAYEDNKEETVAPRGAPWLQSLSAFAEWLETVASSRIFICPSKSLTMGVEVGFTYRLGGLPRIFNELLGWGVHHAVVSPQPAYDRRVVELYIPGMLYERPWADVRDELHSFINFLDI